jgi:hypothetical protein
MQCLFNSTKIEMWQEPEIEGMITFKTTEHWDQFVVPRPAFEAGGGRRESVRF